MTSIRKVDNSSGQVYTEITSAAPSRFTNGAAWIHESPYLPPGWEEGSPIGASPLMHLAMRGVLSDQRRLTASLFANVPWRLASYLWDCLGRCKKRTLHMWKLFATAYPAQFSELEHYRSMNIENPRVSMREYLELVKSDKLSWLVVLTLGTSYARVPELVGISDITNLVALEIATPPPRRGVPPEEPSIPVTALTDRIIRTWSELAQTAGAFPHLRLLILQHQRALSKVALRYLRALPALQFVVVDSCDDIASAVYGNEVDEWTVVERKHFPSKLHEFYLSTCSRSRREELAPVEPPILDFQVGQKKRRSNNTRCHSPIYLQRTELKVGEVDPEPSNRKRKEGAADSQLNGSQPRKAVMKDRTMDIGDVLKGFF